MTSDFNKVFKTIFIIALVLFVFLYYRTNKYTYFEIGESHSSFRVNNINEKVEYLNPKTGTYVEFKPQID